MSQVVINASYCGNTYNINTNFSTGRNATDGSSTSDAICGVGQSYGSPNYLFYRGFIYFDTSGIPATAIITAATISFTNGLLGDLSTTDFNVIIRGASSASNPLVLGDYDLTNYSGDNLGELTLSTNYSNFTLNANGRAYINKGGTTKFVLLSEEDINNDPPTNNEYVLYRSNVANNEVKLTVTYYEPTETPTVTTTDAACEDRQSTTLTAVGTVSDAGGGYTFRGFEYYEHGATLEYDSSMYAVREIGTFSTAGVFRMTLNGLKPSTTYYIRAFAGNVFGIAYGEWVECSTTAVPSYDVYEEANTAKYTLYVSDDEAIAWRGYRGPYSGKQQNINITDLVNKTKGVKVIKLVPTAKGTFQVVVTVKQQLKN
jgi:hypothetical protein